MKRLKAIAAVLVVLVAFTLPGCMGRMALSGTISRFNMNAAESKWGREGLFLGLHLTGVYAFCAMADLLVINSIEFWEGENPLSGEPPLTEASSE